MEFFYGKLIESQDSEAPRYFISFKNQKDSNTFKSNRIMQSVYSLNDLNRSVYMNIWKCIS